MFLISNIDIQADSVSMAIMETEEFPAIAKIVKLAKLRDFPIEVKMFKRTGEEGFTLKGKKKMGADVKFRTFFDWSLQDEVVTWFVEFKVDWE